MKRSIHRWPLAGGVALVAVIASATLQAQEPPKPTKEHEELKSEVGAWDAEVSMWMSPDAEPMKSKAVETNEMFGDFWLMSEFEGEFGGEKFKGHSMLGYDPAKKKYVGTWTDTMSPYLMTMEGDYDEATHTSTMYGMGTSMETGKAEKSKMVTVYTSDDEKTFTMYMEKPGAEDEWIKVMEIKYKRRK
jgi:hypothetical protein